MAEKQLRAGIHARRSLNRRDEQSASVRRQIEAGREVAGRAGAQVVKVYDEDDTSAFEKRIVQLPDGRRVRRNVRPDWQEALRDLYDGTIDILIEYDLDRAMREPRDLEDLIEVVETTGRQVESVTGSLRLRNDHEITMARVMVAMANKSSRDTARRVRDAARERAVKGLNHGGKRCFGHTPDGRGLIAEEAAEVARMYSQFIAGVPLAVIVRDLNARGVRTVSGKLWASGTLRETLRRPRHAGLSEYHGEIVGKGQWSPIVSEETWRSAVALLDDPARRTSTGNKASYLLSGIARCGVCDSPISAAGLKRSGPDGAPRHIYRCKPPNGKAGYCVGRRRDWCDDWVTEQILHRVTREDVTDLILNRDEPDHDALDDEARDIRLQLDDAAASFASRSIDVRQLEIITKTLQGRLGEIAKVRRTSHRRLVLEDIVDAVVEAGNDEAVRWAAAEAVWKSKSLDQQRAIVDVLVTVRLQPGGSGRRVFDPTKVEVIPKS